MPVRRLLFSLVFVWIGLATAATALADGIVADHECTDLSVVPERWVGRAKETLRIAYGHTSHGSQITSGMKGLAAWKGDLYAFRTGGRGGALDLRDGAMRGASDLGNPDRRAWAEATSTYLAANSDVNVVMWSWCGQAATSTANIDIYLDLMEALIKKHPKVRFVFMTGHLDGRGLDGRLHLANEHIRAHCRKKGRILFDFADIESYDPDGNYFGDKAASDGCDYDSDGDGRRDRNWARDWQDAHEEGKDWYRCSSAHSQPLNANRKAYAAWWLWARLAGWSGPGRRPLGTDAITTLLDAGAAAERRPALAARIRDVRVQRMKALEKDETVRAEKKAWERLERALTAQLRSLEMVAQDNADSPSGKHAARLAGEIRDLLDTGGVQTGH